MRLEIEKCQSQHQQQWEMQQHQQQQQQPQPQQQRSDSLDLTKVSSASSWLNTTNGSSCTNAFVGTANGNVMGNSLPFFASQDSSALQLNPATEVRIFFPERRQTNIPDVNLLFASVQLELRICWGLTRCRVITRFNAAHSKRGFGVLLESPALLLPPKGS